MSRVSVCAKCTNRLIGYHSLTMISITCAAFQQPRLVLRTRALLLCQFNLVVFGHVNVAVFTDAHRVSLHGSLCWAVDHGSSMQVVIGLVPGARHCRFAVLVVDNPFT